MIGTKKIRAELIAHTIYAKVSLDSQDVVEKSELFRIAFRVKGMNCDVFPNDVVKEIVKLKDDEIKVIYQPLKDTIKREILVVGVKIFRPDIIQKITEAIGKSGYTAELEGFVEVYEDDHIGFNSWTDRWIKVLGKTPVATKEIHRIH